MEQQLEGGAVGGEEERRQRKAATQALIKTFERATKPLQDLLSGLVGVKPPDYGSMEVRSTLFPPCSYLPSFSRLSFNPVNCSAQSHSEIPRIQGSHRCTSTLRDTTHTSLPRLHIHTPGYHVYKVTTAAHPHICHCCFQVGFEAQIRVEIVGAIVSVCEVQDWQVAKQHAAVLQQRRAAKGGSSAAPAVLNVEVSTSAFLLTCPSWPAHGRALLSHSLYNAIYSFIYAIYSLYMQSTVCQLATVTRFCCLCQLVRCLCIHQHIDACA